MKTKICFVMSLFLSASLIIQAQSNSNSLKPAFGLKGGINVSNVWDSKDDSFVADPKVGFAGGFFVGIPFSKTFGLQPEILLSQKGFKGSGTLLGSPYSFTRTTTFIDIPVQLQVKPLSFLTILAGPYLSFLLNQKDTYTYGDNSVEQTEEFNKDVFRKNLFGFTGGVDLNFQHFLFSTRIGLDFQENVGNESTLTPRYKNQWLQFGVGYTF